MHELLLNETEGGASSTSGGPSVDQNRIEQDRLLCRAAGWGLIAVGLLQRGIAGVLCGVCGGILLSRTNVLSAPRSRSTAPLSQVKWVPNHAPEGRDVPTGTVPVGRGSSAQDTIGRDSVEVASDDSFPASDAPAWTMGH
jgi:hypothetical protein